MLWHSVQGVPFKGSIWEHYNTHLTGETSGAALSEATIGWLERLAPLWPRVVVARPPARREVLGRGRVAALG